MYEIQVSRPTGLSQQDEAVWLMEEAAAALEAADIPIESITKYGIVNLSEDLSVVVAE